MNKKGFTIVELVVAMTIVVILSGVAFISYSEHLTNARNMQRKADLNSLSVALDGHLKNFGEYPTPSNTSINDDFFVQGELGENTGLTNMKKIPTDPKTNKPYVYSKSILSEHEPVYEIAGSLELKTPKAIVVGNYTPIKTNYPSLIYIGSVADNNAVIDGKENLPYSFKGTNSPANGFTIDSNIFKYPNIGCDGIKKAKRFAGNGTYKFAGNTSITCND